MSCKPSQLSKFAANPCLLGAIRHHLASSCLHSHVDTHGVAARVRKRLANMHGIASASAVSVALSLSVQG